MRLYKRWKDVQQQSAEDNTSYTFLPPIIGLHSVQLEPKRFVNIIVKLNSVRIDYPVCERLWDN
jgi:hypothetical protein